MSEKIYSWKFNDTKNRWKMWYIIAISIVIWATIWWFLTKQYWLSFIILLIAGLYYFVENNSVDNVEVTITNEWIKIDWVYYDYSSIDSYWFIYKSEEPIWLRLFLNKKWIRFIDLKIKRQNISEIRLNLNNYLEESEKIELNFSEKMINILKL
jgi:hypothetical protein